MTSFRALAPTLLILLWSADASAGWYAKQTSGATGQPAGQEMSAEIFYEGGRLRIDQGPMSLIYDMKNGRMIMLDHNGKAFTDQTVDELLEMRAQMIAGIKARLPSMPAEVQAQMKEQLEMLDSAEQELPKATGNKATVGKFPCEIYRWKNKSSEGEICLSKKTGVDMKDFVAEAQKLSATLAKLAGPGQSGGSTAMLRMAKEGFPVRVTQKIRMPAMGAGEPKWMESHSEVKELKEMKVPADKFAVPKDYQKREIPKVGMPPAPVK